MLQELRENIVKEAQWWPDLTNLVINPVKAGNPVMPGLKAFGKAHPMGSALAMALLAPIAIRTINNVLNPGPGGNYYA